MKRNETSKGTTDIIPEEVLRFFAEEQKKITQNLDWKSLYKSYIRLYKVCLAKALPFDPRFNAVHWALDSFSICNEIAYSYSWMQAYARHYKRKYTRGSQLSHNDFHVEYFANYCTTLIDSCRDKIALIAWAYYCAFNPERAPEVLTYEKVIERLKYPIRFALYLPGANSFIIVLESLENSDFKTIEQYRHYKIHRLEPRIDIYGVQAHHGWSYMFPLTKANEIKEFKKSIKKQYPTTSDTHNIFDPAKIAEEQCKINGILFDQRRVKDQYWDYSGIANKSSRCLFKLFRATEGCISILLRRKPLRGRKSSQE